MPRATNHQVIWKRKGAEHDGLELDLPKKINSDIGFQLMFGVSTNYIEDNKKEEQHHLNYSLDVDIMTLEDIIVRFK